MGARARSRGRKPAVGTPIRSSAKTREDPFPGPLSDLFDCKSRSGLVPAAAATAAATAVAAAATPTAAATTAVAAATAAAAATATTVAAATAAATTAATILAGLGFVDRQRPAAVLLAVQRRDRGLRLVVATHFHEPEALRAPGHAVADHFGALHRAVLREQLFQVRARDVVAQVTHVQLLAHWIAPVCWASTRVLLSGSLVKEADIPA